MAKRHMYISEPTAEPIDKLGWAEFEFARAKEYLEQIKKEVLEQRINDPKLTEEEKLSIRTYLAQAEASPRDEVLEELFYGVGSEGPSGSELDSYADKHGK